MTRLIEFASHKGETLRGLLDEATSDRGILFVHGFERTAFESKFKRIAGALRGSVNLFRFDFSGCGLSDGSFEDLTVEKLSQELVCAVNILQEKCSNIHKLSFVGFSLGGCIITKYLIDSARKADRLAFFAPGFNQKQLLRYFFTRQQHRDILISWDNFTSYLDEEAFQLDIQKHQRMMKEHYLSSAYFTENAEKDYQQDFLALGYETDRVMILQGADDDKVPPGSNETVYSVYKSFIIAAGDHDLQRPDMVEQYFERLIAFLKK